MTIIVIITIVLLVRVTNCVVVNDGLEHGGDGGDGDVDDVITSILARTVHPREGRVQRVLPHAAVDRGAPKHLRTCGFSSSQSSIRTPSQASLRTLAAKKSSLAPFPLLRTLAAKKSGQTVGAFE